MPAVGDSELFCDILREKCGMKKINFALASGKYASYSSAAFPAVRQ